MTTPSHASGPSLWAIARGSVLLWVGTLFSIVGLVFLTFGVRTSLEEHAYKTRGLDVQALVIEKTLVRADHQDNPHTRHLVAYRFTSANGEVIDGTADVPVEQWERLEAGQPFAVTYLPGDPDSSRHPGRFPGCRSFPRSGSLPRSGSFPGRRSSPDPCQVRRCPSGQDPRSDQNRRRRARRRSSG